MNTRHFKPCTRGERKIKLVEEITKTHMKTLTSFRVAGHNKHGNLLTYFLIFRSGLQSNLGYMVILLLSHINHRLRDSIENISLFALLNTSSFY